MIDFTLAYCKLAMLGVTVPQSLKLVASASYAIYTNREPKIFQRHR